MSPNLVDLHCHILPGIDDGAKNLDVSMALLRKEVQDGVAGIVFTPHFHYERISVEDFAAKRRAAFLQVAKAAKETGLPLAAKLAACCTRLSGLAGGCRSSGSRCKADAPGSIPVILAASGPCGLPAPGRWR